MNPYWKRVSASPSKSFAAAAVCFVLGIAFGPMVAGSRDPAYGDLLLLVVLIGAGLAILLPSRHKRLLVILALLVLFGIWRYEQALIPTDAPTIEDAAGQPVEIVGTVSSEVQQRLGSQRVVLDRLSVADETVDGKLLVWLDAYPIVAYGDTLTFNCAPELPQPIETFRYDRYLRSQGILADCLRPQYLDVVSAPSGGMIATLLSIKRVIVQRLQMIVPEPHASFLSGLLFGGSSSLSKELKDDFSATGTSHILAASGFNVSLFSLTFLYWITHTTLGRKRGTYLTAALLVAYVFIAGASASVVRAAVMGSLALVGFFIRRTPYMTNVLLLALSGMLLVNPLLLRDDVGFQLSFVATAAMLLWATKIEKRCTFIPDAFQIRSSFAASIAAILATLPIMLWHFGTVSIISPLVNLLVLPLVPMLMSLTGIAIAAGFLNPLFGTVVATPAWAVSSVILHVISWFGS
jgi:competence protein ComEC